MAYDHADTWSGRHGKVCALLLEELSHDEGCAAFGRAVESIWLGVTCPAEQARCVTE